ncbi:hypothetical protein BpHYR1_032015 [Brachionus plicatilis]|uniref:Uncharacterized protein n=1 Tax=Brachionus plicatilis TaxID=10195 RepID=A0A3M7T1R7_BRAPC|nr:hypothetical protein BpHYR1_032015 [Brachionus plicatilis]
MDDTWLWCIMANIPKALGALYNICQKVWQEQKHNYLRYKENIYSIAIIDSTVESICAKLMPVSSTKILTLTKLLLEKKCSLLKILNDIFKSNEDKTK